MPLNFKTSTTIFGRTYWPIRVYTSAANAKNDTGQKVEYIEPGLIASVRPAHGASLKDAEVAVINMIGRGDLNIRIEDLECQGFDC